jgi:hypothetical protein
MRVIEPVTAPMSVSEAPPNDEEQVTSDRSSVASLIVIRKSRRKVLEKFEISARLAKEARQTGSELQSIRCK